MSEKRKAALFYAKHLGWKVLPLHTPINGGCSCKNKADCNDVGKHPRNRDGVTGATDDLKIINKWWSKWPDANIGIATGAVSGLVAVDIDPRHGGDESLYELINEYGPLPNTVEAITGSGGRHILFEYPSFHIKNLNHGEIAQGIDIKGDGGYIVVAPSLHKSRNYYEWELSSHPREVPIAPLPDWLKKKLWSLIQSEETSAHQALPAEVWHEMMQGVTEGRRNNTVLRIAGHLLRRYVNPTLTLQLILAWNRIYCHPPLSETEVVRTVNSVARMELRRRKGEAKHGA